MDIYGAIGGQQPLSLAFFDDEDSDGKILTPPALDPNFRDPAPCTITTGAVSPVLIFGINEDMHCITFARTGLGLSRSQKKEAEYKRDVDFYEINGAFASQAIFSVQHLGIPFEKANAVGGAIAIGQPLGCTSARQVATGFSVAKPQRRVGRNGCAQRQDGPTADFGIFRHLYCLLDDRRDFVVSKLFATFFSFIAEMSAITPQQLGAIEEFFPTEIIAHIFILCLPKDPLRHFQPDLTRAPLFLCHNDSDFALGSIQISNQFLFGKIHTTGMIRPETGLKREHYFLPNVLPSGKIHFSPSHLTHLFVNLSLSLSKWAILISGCETLEYARIHLTIKPEVEDNPVATRTSQSIVPRLRQLVLDCSSPELEHVLDNLSLPSLHSLHLRSEASALYGYVLPQLSICGLAALLSATPSLRILEISIPFRYNWISNLPTPSIPGHQRLGKCAPSLELLVLDVFNTRPGYHGMSPMEYISEMKNCGWLDNVWNRPTTEQTLRIVLVLEFPRNILHWLERVEDELDGVHISAEISTSTALGAWEISQEEHPKDRWFKQAKCPRLI
ncbi:hypothetical protein M413DRAFT_435018 [Hebeloma cylindrosporum]|uniref:Thiolase C-terminal domain-containing protein n=1 Tax=Hebeloma cylindrosporum TaxID=76867 RepID=A0A0C3BDA8_HEBCY|nr:hypothetical protein M413DRAFT_435018 [Hebeloma cylindrosporum h7]